MITLWPITAALTGTKNATGRTRGVQSGKNKKRSRAWSAVTVAVNSYLRKLSQRRDPITGAKVGTAANGVTMDDDDAIEVQSIHLRLSPLRFLLLFHSSGNIT
jgi:hypothetical protein